MKVSLAPEAETDLVEGGRYYSREANKELAHAFAPEFERSVALLADQPRLGAPWRGEVHRLPLRRFPYSIVYYLDQTSVRVLRSLTKAASPASGAAVRSIRSLCQP